MRILTFVVLFGLMPLVGQTSDEKEAVATVEKTFKGMAARDAAMIRSTMLPEARLYSVREDGSTTSTAVEDFATRMAPGKSESLERFTSSPKVLVRGRMAQLWGEYEFWRDGKVTHCGVDSASVFKTADRWKIASLALMVEPDGCKAR